MKTNNKAITLIALVITIIVILILAAISIVGLFGNDGLITRAKWSSFVAELSAVKESAIIKENNHALEIYTQSVISSEIQVSAFTKFDKEKIQEQLNINKLPETLEEEMSILGTGNENIYIIDKKTGLGKEKTYLWDDHKKIVYKIQGINIYGTTVHSIEGGEFRKKESNIKIEEQPINIAEMEVEYKYGYYEPDLNGFDSDRTYVIYYSSDWTTYKEVLLKDYISGGKQKTIQEAGQNYTFYNYNSTALSSTWGNVKTYANGQESWWTWIPRYAYDTSNMNKQPAEGESAIKIKFITVENKYIIEENGAYIAENDVATPDIAHPSFTIKNGDVIEKELKGIWMSKYEPSVNTEKDVQEDSSYISPKHYIPDITGFNTQQTYLVKYDETGTNIASESLLSEVGTTDAELKKYANEKSNGIWYDYSKKIWANVKTTANGTTAYWVWIPRYAYSIQTTSKEVSIIFIDLSNKPMDTKTYPNGLPEGYIVHPAFNPDEETGLKGIWMSKYEPSGTPTTEEKTME